MPCKENYLLYQRVQVQDRVQDCGESDGAPACLCSRGVGTNQGGEIFGLRRTSNPMPIIYAAPPSNIDLREDGRPLTLNIEFEKTRPVLDFVTKLYKNGVKEEDLRQGARYRIKDQYVIFDIKVEIILF